MLELHKIRSVLDLVLFSTVFILFHEQRWQGGVFKVIKNDHFLNIFSSLRPYPQVFGQAKKWLIVGLHEMIRVPRVVACPMDFNLLCDRGHQGGVLKL